MLAPEPIDVGDFGEEFIGDYAQTCLELGLLSRRQKTASLDFNHLLFLVNYNANSVYPCRDFRIDFRV